MGEAVDQPRAITPASVSRITCGAIQVFDMYRGWCTKGGMGAERGAEGWGEVQDRGQRCAGGGSGRCAGRGQKCQTSTSISAKQVPEVCNKCRTGTKVVQAGA